MRHTVSSRSLGPFHPVFTPPKSRPVPVLPNPKPESSTFRDPYDRVLPVQIPVVPPFSLPPMLAIARHPRTLYRSLCAGGGQRSHTADHKVLEQLVRIGARTALVLPEVGDLGAAASALEGAVKGTGVVDHVALLGGRKASCGCDWGIGGSAGNGAQGAGGWSCERRSHCEGVAEQLRALGEDGGWEGEMMMSRGSLYFELLLRNYSRGLRLQLITAARSLAAHTEN